MNDERLYLPQDGFEPGELGSEIRALRKAQGMTLEQLAVSAELSIGFLSLVERGKKRPSAAALSRISDAFGVPAEWFFPQRPSQDPLERAYVVRDGYRRRIDYERLVGTDYDGEADYLLSPTLDGMLTMTLMTFRPGGDSGSEPLVHAGEEVGYVLSGSLWLELDGTAVVLEAGDSFGIPGSLPHRYLNGGAEEVQVILVNTPAFIAPR